MTQRFGVVEYGPFPHRDVGSDPRLPPLALYFFEQAVKNELASERDGIPIYDKATFVRIVIPGARNSAAIKELTRITRDKDGKEIEKTDPHEMRRFRATYNEFLENRTPSGSGTPLEVWPLMDVALVASFKEFNVLTVQDMASLSDGAMENIRVPKVREWRAKAQGWLQDGQNAVGQAKLEKENAELRERIDRLERMAAMSATQQNTEGFERRRRGRPPKARPDELDVSDDDFDIPDNEIADALDGGDDRL